MTHDWLVPEMLSDIRGKTPLMPQSAINLDGCTPGMIIKFKSFLHMFFLKMLKVLCEYQTQQPIVMKFSDIVYA